MGGGENLGPVLTGEACSALFERNLKARWGNQSHREEDAAANPPERLKVRTKGVIGKKGRGGDGSGANPCLSQNGIRTK